MSISTNNELTKDTVLAATKDGFLFYKQIIPNLKLNSNNRSCRAVLNPFYNDTKPSLSIYYWYGEWRFKDYGEEIYCGDVFDFAAFHYGIDPVIESDLLLTTMLNEVKNFDNTTINSWVQPNILERENNLVKVSFTDRKSSDFTTVEIAYWAQYGIDTVTLDQHRVVALDSYSTLYDEDLYPITKEKPTNKM